jgi:glucose/arabinose dehydrogenase
MVIKSFCIFALLLTSIALLPGCGGGGGGGGGGGEDTVSNVPPDPSPNTPPPNSPPPLALSTVVNGLVSPIGLEAPNDGTGRLFAVEQAGRIRIIQNDVLLVDPFLNLTASVESGGEKGLLGLAFHPNFAGNRRFFVNYTRRVGAQLQSVISEFSASVANMNQADPATERLLLVVNQPFDNHNGGQLAFGQDGLLYIALGDGGSGGDPFGNGQSLSTLLGKILRIDVDSPPAPGNQYVIPPDNPFSVAGGLPEIWAYGFRNPWRFSFDPPTGRLFAGDVGENSWEEVNLVTRGGNFGWNIMEGNHCFPPSATMCNTTGLILPIFEYGHVTGGGISIIGGFVYRGSAIPGLVGTYVFADLSGGRVWGLTQNSQGGWDQTDLLIHGLTVSAFGRDTGGELYLIDYRGGSIRRLVAAP